MTTQDYLNQVEKLDRIIQNKLSEIYQLKTIACNVTSTQKEINVKSTSEKDRMGVTVSKMVDLEKEMSELIEELMKKKSTIISQMEQCQNYTILYDHYIYRKTLGEIADVIPCSYRHVKRMHRNAIDEFENKFGESYL